MQQHDSKYFACRLPPPQGWGQKVKIQLFQNMVMLHIKLKGMTNANHAGTCSVLTYTLDRLVRLRVKIIFCRKVVIFHIANQ